MQILIIALWYGISHLFILCRKLKESENVPVDFYIMTNLVHLLSISRRCTMHVSRINSCALQFLKL